MATFYLLPPRACLDQAIRDLFARLLPGLSLPTNGWDMLADHLATTGNWPAEVFLVPRDDLPDDDPDETLTEAFGAEPGDRIIEVSLARPARERTIPVPPVHISYPTPAR